MSPLARPAAVLWDLDGTVLHCEDVYDACLVRAARAAGVPEAALPSAEESLAMHGMTMADEFAFVLALAERKLAGAGAGAGEAALPAAAALEAAFWAEFEAASWTDAGLVLPGVEAASAALAAAGVPQAVATMSTRREVDAKRPACPAFFARMEAVVCWGMPEVARPKPAPDAYLEAARRLGVDARRCVVMEDTLRGTAAGAAAGAAVIAVPSTRPYDEAAFRASGATLVLDSFAAADFFAWLKQQPDGAEARLEERTT